MAIKSSKLRPAEPRKSARLPQLQRDAATSKRLGQVRQKDTAAEITVRCALHQLGARFRVRNRDLPGSPDVANRAKRWAIFVHGCFWHRHRGCHRTTTPTRNREFWLAKFEANVDRDARVIGSLVDEGYRVLVVWECESEQPDLLTRRLRQFLRARRLR